MIKVLFIIPNLRKGGAERLVIDICNELINRKHILVKLITFTDHNEYFSLTKNIDWQVVSAHIRLYITKKNRFSVDHLQHAINEFQPDIIHTHLFEAEIVSRTCYYPSAKWFTHCHDNMIQFENLSLKTFFNKKALTNYFEKRYLLKRYHINGGNRFIAVSNHTKQYFEKTVKEFPVILLHNAINLSKFFNKKNNSYHIKKLRLINVGSLINRKNQSFLIDVAVLLRKKNVDFLLVLLGDGVNRAKLQKKITENNLENFVKLMGNVDNVEDYLRNSDIYVHSSFSEPFGLSIIEAMATGLPVVTIDGKGNRDLIENGKNGFILYEQNVELFADKIIELWSNKALYESMSHYAQEFAKKFDIKLYVHKLLQLYEDALNNKI